jgi:hypothetical protein
MALRPLGLPQVPVTNDPNLEWWMQQVKEAIEGLPFSYFSTTDGPNTSAITAPIGTLGIEIGSSGTKLWVKETAPATGWAEVDTT